jgi:hypothetical protein
MVRLLLAVLIGVGATLAWQSHGDQFKQMVGPWAAEMVMTQAPSLVWLLPNWTKSPSEVSPTMTPQVPDAAIPQRAPVVRTISTSPETGTSADVAEQLAAMARDLAFLRRSVDEMQAELARKLAFPPVPPVIATPVDQSAPVVARPQPAPRPPNAPPRLAPSTVR